jgi:MYXO-CTERM domain-containing protein
MLCAVTASAAPILSANFSKNIVGGPFGPFTTDQDVVIIATLKNESATQELSICPGICTGGPFTYSLGGLASTPQGYSFFFGNDPGSEPDGFDSQTLGPLAPGAERDFTFGINRPALGLLPGTVSFGVQLQIFEATDSRPMINSASFGGTWQVTQAVPEPTTALLALSALVAIAGLRTRHRQRGLRTSQINAQEAIMASWLRCASTAAERRQQSADAKAGRATRAVG